MKTFVLGILAGVMISIGGIIYLSVDNKIIGSFLFSVGLFYVLTAQLNLFTGKVGYLVNNKPSYILDLLLMWLGNFAGAFILGNLMRLTRNFKISEKAAALCQIKLDDNVLSIFILSLLCGILMFLAVDTYKNLDNQFGKVIGVIFSVMVFIVSGFEHCVANMFYFSVSSIWSVKVIIYILIMTLGNSAGALIISSSKKYFKF